MTYVGTYVYLNLEIMYLPTMCYVQYDGFIGIKHHKTGTVTWSEL